MEGEVVVSVGVGVGVGDGVISATQTAFTKTLEEVE